MTFCAVKPLTSNFHDPKRITHQPPRSSHQPPRSSPTESPKPKPALKSSTSVSTGHEKIFVFAAAHNGSGRIGKLLQSLGSDPPAMEEEHHRDPGTFKGGYVSSLEVYIVSVYIYIYAWFTAWEIDPFLWDQRWIFLHLEISS